jgi:hypothetical protein
MDPDEGDRVKGSYVDRSFKSPEVQATPTASTTRTQESWMLSRQEIPIPVKNAQQASKHPVRLYLGLDASETVRSHIYDVPPGGLLQRNNRS